MSVGLSPDCATVRELQACVAAWHKGQLSAALSIMHMGLPCVTEHMQPFKGAIVPGYVPGP
jgi:hypothetical protein